MSTLTFKLIDAINDLSGGGSTDTETGTVTTSRIQCIPCRSDFKMGVPKYLTLCKYEAGNFCDGYLVDEPKTIHVETAVLKENETVFNITATSKGSEALTDDYEGKIITYNGQKYVAVKFTSTDSGGMCFFYYRILCSNASDVMELETENVTNETNINISLEL